MHMSPLLLLLQQLNQCGYPVPLLAASEARPSSLSGKHCQKWPANLPCGGVNCDTHTRSLTTKVTLPTRTRADGQKTMFITDRTHDASRSCHRINHQPNNVGSIRHVALAHAAYCLLLAAALLVCSVCNCQWVDHGGPGVGVCGLLCLGLWTCNVGVAGGGAATSDQRTCCLPGHSSRLGRCGMLWPSPRGEGGGRLSWGERLGVACVVALDG
jgi:hypothetical protein